MILTHKLKGKFEPQWEGPYVADEVYSNGTYALHNKERDWSMMPINGKFLQKVFYLIIILLLNPLHTMLRTF